MVENTLINLPKVRIRLTIPLVAMYLSQGYRVSQIASMTNQAGSWVSQYLKKHYDDLLPLIENQDVLAAMQAKYIAQRAKDKLVDIIDTTTDFSKKDLIPLTAVSDRHTQQYRLLADKSTQNISYDQAEANEQEAEKEIQLLLKQLGNGGDS